MFSRAHRRASEGRRGIAVRGFAVAADRLLGGGAWVGRAPTVPSCRRESKGLMRLAHGDIQTGRPAYRRPTERKRAGWEGTVH